MKKLYKSKTDKIIFGVCGGIAEYLEADATIVRLIAILLFVFSGFFPIGVAYLVAAVVMPEKKK
ncbi:PspC domain-containing protein [Patescibacteria group bacterium]|nr:PspC domain-containing protein [Patescibacteria group bacterium]